MLFYTDGFKNNREQGYTICDEAGALVKRDTYARHITNNEAELLGIYHAAGMASPGDEIVTDSKVCVAWIKNRCSEARPNLNDLIRDTADIIAAKYITLRWRPREKNLAGIYNEQQSC